jgi:hypothetical protein
MTDRDWVWFIDLLILTSDWLRTLITTYWHWLWLTLVVTNWKILTENTDYDWLTDIDGNWLTDWVWFTDWLLLTENWLRTLIMAEYLADIDWCWLTRLIWGQHVWLLGVITLDYQTTIVLTLFVVKLTLEYRARVSLCSTAWPWTWDPPVSTSQVLGIIDMCHHAWLSTGYVWL